MCTFSAVRGHLLLSSMVILIFLSSTMFEVQFLHSSTPDIIKCLNVGNQVGISLS